MRIVYVAVVCLLATRGASAQIVVANSSASQNQGISNSLTWSHTVNPGAGRMLLVGLASEDTFATSLPATAVSFGSQSLINVGASLTVTTDRSDRVEWWYLANPNATTANITVNYAGFSLVKFAGGITLHNTTGAAPSPTAVNSNINSNVITTTLNSVPANSWVFDIVIHSGSSGSFTGNNGQTELWDSNFGGSGASAVSGYQAGVAGAVPTGWTFSSPPAVGFRMAQSAIAVQAIPEPTSFMLLAAVGGLGLLRRRRA